MYVIHVHSLSFLIPHLILNVGKFLHIIFYLPGVKWIHIGISVLGGAVVMIIFIFLRYWLKKSDITKPAPNPYIPDKLIKMQVSFII